MRLRWARRAALQSLTAMAVAAATPGIGGQAWLAGVAFVPWLLSLRGLSPGHAVLWGWCGGMALTALGKWGAFAQPLATLGYDGALRQLLVLGFFAIQALPYAVFAGIWQAGRRWHGLALAPWLGGFTLAALFQVIPLIFPYTPAVMISSVPELTQLAALGGEALLLAMLFTVNLGVIALLADRRRQAVTAIVLPLVLALGYGASVLPVWRAPPSAQLSVLSLQGQWPHHASERMLLRDSPRRTARSLPELTRSGLAAAPGCDLVLWPESPGRVQAPDPVCTQAASLSLALDRPILSTCHVPDDNGRTLAARLHTPAGVRGEHRKSRLVPFYEARLNPSADSLTPGEGMSLLQTGGLPPLAPAICYEAHFSADLRRAVEQGAGVLLHMANFATFRDPALSAWDLAMVRIRAVELRRSVVRSVNAGEAGLINAAGDWMPTAPPGATGVRCHTAPVHYRHSVYSRYGSAVFWLAWAVLAGIFARIALRSRISNPPS